MRLNLLLFVLHAGVYRPPRLAMAAMEDDPDRRQSAKERRREREASRRGGRSALVCPAAAVLLTTLLNCLCGHRSEMHCRLPLLPPCDGAPLRKLQVRVSTWRIEHASSQFFCPLLHSSVALDHLVSARIRATLCLIWIYSSYFAAARAGTGGGGGAGGGARGGRRRRRGHGRRVGGRAAAAARAAGARRHRGGHDDARAIVQGGCHLLLRYCEQPAWLAFIT
jgi:hypothetical protein